MLRGTFLTVPASNLLIAVSKRASEDNMDATWIVSANASRARFFPKRMLPILWKKPTTWSMRPSDFERPKPSRAR